MLRNILVRVPNWLGDAVLSLPAVRAIRPHAERLIVMARPPAGGLYVGIADEVLDARLPLRSAVASVRRCCPEVAVLFQNSFYSALVPRLAGCPEIWGYAKNGRSILLTRRVRATRDIYEEHQIYYHWRFVKALGLADGEPPAISLTPTAESPLEGGARWIGMSPGAKYGEAKRWLPESYAALGRMLAARGYRVALFGSGEELRGCGEIAAEIGPAARTLAGKTDLQQLIAGIAACAVFVTNDSGSLHIASALNVPLVAIFGSTDPRSTGPRNARSIVLRRPLPCAPCHRRRCPIDHRCMTRIHAEEALAAVLRLDNG